MFLVLMTFLFGSRLFTVILTPGGTSFVVCHFFYQVTSFVTVPSLYPRIFCIGVVGARLTTRFVARVDISFCANFLLTSPCIVCRLFHFISPTLCRGRGGCSAQVMK